MAKVKKSCAGFIKEELILDGIRAAFQFMSFLPINHGIQGHLPSFTYPPNMVGYHHPHHAHLSLQAHLFV